MSRLSEYDKAHIGDILADTDNRRWDWFTCHLLRLICKADERNLRLLAQVYPEAVEAVLRWKCQPATVEQLLREISEERRRLGQRILAEELAGDTWHMHLGQPGDRSFTGLAKDCPLCADAKTRAIESGAAFGFGEGDDGQG